MITREGLEVDGEVRFFFVLYVICDARLMGEIPNSHLFDPGVMEVSIFTPTQHSTAQPCLHYTPPPQPSAR